MSALAATTNYFERGGHRYQDEAYSDDAKQLSQKERELVEALRSGRAITPPFDLLPPGLAADISARWSLPCEAAFEYLAARAPNALLCLIIEGQMDAADLTFAAEIAGRLRNSLEVVRALRPLLNHPAAVVREGAIYGLANHLDPTLRSNLETLAEQDPSAAVRRAATDAVSEG